MLRRLPPAVRAVAAAAALGGLALAASSCAGVTPAAMTVNGEDVSIDAVRSDIDGLAASKTFTSQNGEIRLAKGVYDPRIMAAVLRQRFYGTVFEQALSKRKVQPQPLSAAMQTRVEESVGGKDVFKELSPAFRKQLVRQTIVQFTLVDTLTTELGSPEVYYEAHKSEFADACVSHFLVADLATAQKARARVIAGAKFASVASEVSTDTGSKTQGGELGCGPTSRFVAEFANVATTLPLGEISEPVQSQFGYHVIVVSKRTNKPFADVKTDVESRLETVSNTRLETLIRSAKVSVNPKFGVFAADGGDGFPSILPVGSTVPKP